MSDEQHKTPGERLLDLLVFGPAGLAATAAEEFPRLVEKGRHRVEGQVHAARLVGQFAVQMGRRQLEQTVGSLAHRSSPAPTPTPRSAPGPAPVPDAAASDHGAPASPPSPSPSTGTTTAGSPNGTLASSALGIPGYDSLSASQVVQRLGGLSGAELEAVRGHEAAHRHRRTILNRVDQLLGGEGDHS